MEKFNVSLEIEFLNPKMGFEISVLEKQEQRQKFSLRQSTYFQGIALESLAACF